MIRQTFAMLLALMVPSWSGPAAGGATGLSRSEQALVRGVDASSAEAVALLERVVNINSGTMNLAGVREVGTIFRAQLDALGFTTTWIDGAAFQRAGHLVATRRGPGRGPRLVLIGHLDTVFERDSPFQAFERVDARTARGPGIIDMKGGDVVMVFALKALQAAGELDAMQLTVVMTGDEESPGTPLPLARAPLVDAARGADAAIGFEDGPGDPRYAVTARRGTTGWELRVTGTPAHSSQIFRDDVGSGAVFEAARIVNAFRERMSGEPHLTLNPGVLLAGTAVDYDAAHASGTAAGKDNVIAGQAVASGDLRTLTRSQLEKAKATMRDIVSASLPHTQAQITFDEGYPPLAPTPGNDALLAIYDRASRDLGLGPVSAASADRAGAADVAFVSAEVPRILDGIGLMGGDDHTPNETADLTTLPSQTKRAALLLYRLAAKGR